MALTRPRIEQFNTTVSAISDPITVLKAGTTQANVDIGFLMNRANGLVSNVAVYWSESGNTFVTAFTSNSGATNSNITPTGYATLTTGTLVANGVDVLANVGQLYDTAVSHTNSIAGANAAIITANTSLKNYTDYQITTANTSLKNYTDYQITTANTALKNYTDYQITVANTSVAGYVDARITNLINGAPAALDTLNEIATSLGNNASLSSTLINSINGANAAIVTANSALKSYVDAADSAITVAWTANAASQQGQIATLQSQVYSNSNVNAYLSSTGPGNIAIVNGAFELTATGPGITTVGGSTSIPIITTDVYGRVTALSTASISTTLSTAGTTGTGSIALASQSLTFAGTYGVTVAASGQTLTVATPQDLRIAASPSFTALSVTGSTPSTSTTTGALTVGGGMGVAGNVWIGGNVNLAGNVTTVSFSGNSGSFIGNTLTGYGALYAGIPIGYTVLPSTPFQTATNANTYSQLNQQNVNSGKYASSDYVVTADNGTDSTYYADFGLASSTFNWPELGLTAVGPNDTYLLGVGYSANGPYTGNVGNVVISSSNGRIKFASGGANIANVVAEVSGTQFKVLSSTTSTSTTSGALTVAGGAGIAGNVYVDRVYTNGLYWAANGYVMSTGGGAAAGTTGAMQYNNGGALGASNLFYWSGNSNITAGTIYGTLYDGTTRVITSITSSGAGNVTISGSNPTLTVSLPATGPGATTVGSSTSIPVITTDIYGRITALTSSSVSTTINLAGTTGTGSVAGGGTLTFASTNGVTATASGSTITISDPQDIRTSASPTFAGGSFTGNVARNTKPLITNYTGNIAPTSPIQGDEWFRANTGVMYKYLYDNISSTYNWVNFSSALYNANTAAVANTLALRDSGGNLTATNFLGTASSAKYADLAEIYTSDKNYEPGTVVVFGGTAEITVTKKTHDTRVAGVISTNPAYLMNSEAVGLPVAFTGRVPCLVRGPVSKGDVLVTSAYESYAERMADALYRPGCILGKSLGDVAENVFATIEVVVGRF